MGFCIYTYQYVRTEKDGTTSGPFNEIPEQFKTYTAPLYGWFMCQAYIQQLPKFANTKLEDVRGIVNIDDLINNYPSWETVSQRSDYNPDDWTHKDHDKWLEALRWMGTCNTKYEYELYMLRLG